MDALEAHRLADLIPAMHDEEYGRLREDIAANGLRVPITLYEGKVLDGRNRLRACGETGVEPVFVEYDGDSPAQFVLSLNVNRRHLSVSQRAMIATIFLPELEAEAAERQKRLGGELGGVPSVSPDTEGPRRGQPARSAEAAGKAVDVSGVTVARAKRVLEHAPELAQQVRDGSMTVDGANTILKNKARAGKLESGFVQPASVRRIAEQAEGIALAIGALNLTKSCARMTDEDRSTALAACKTGLRELNAMARALAASEQE